MSGKDSTNRLESLKRIRLSAMMLEVGFKSENLGETLQCQIALEELAASLQAEHGDLITPEQCEAATGSLERFIALIDRAVEKAEPAGETPPVQAKPKSPSMDVPKSQEG